MTDNITRKEEANINMSGEDQYKVLKLLSTMTDLELQEWKLEKSKGKDVRQDIEDRTFERVAKTPEIILEEEVSSLELLLKNEKAYIESLQAEPPMHIPNTQSKKLSVRLFTDELDSFNFQPMEIELPQSNSNIFEAQMETLLDTVQSEKEDTPLTDVHEPVKVTRIDQYKDEYMQRMQSVNTIQDYTEYVKWHHWYFEEDKDTLTLQAKIAAFILTVYVETRVYSTYGMDISELLKTITQANYPVRTPEDIVPQVIAMGKATTAVIERESINFNSTEITFQQLSAMRADNFVGMFTAFI